MAISLEKGQRISLEKESGNSSLKEIFMGLGWDAAKKGQNIDLDASCLIYDDKGKLLETVWFRNLKGLKGAVAHSGDNLTGDGDGDDEVISVKLDQLDKKVKSLVFTVNSFRGQSFNEVKNASCRVVDKSTNKEICSYNLSESGKHTGMIMAKIYRTDDGWKMAALGEKCQGSTVNDIQRLCESLL